MRTGGRLRCVIDLSRGLRHLAWADALLFERLAGMPASALQARYAPDAWTVGRLAQHIVSGAEWYRYCLTGVQWTDLVLPTSADDVIALQGHLAALDALLLEQAAQPDELVTFADEDGPSSAWRSTILTQACLHATEHRAQIACALEVAGIAGLRLDDFDFWAFESFERSAE